MFLVTNICVLHRFVSCSTYSFMFTTRNASLSVAFTALSTMFIKRTVPVTESPLAPYIGILRQFPCSQIRRLPPHLSHRERILLCSQIEVSAPTLLTFTSPSSKFTNRTTVHCQTIYSECQFFQCAQKDVHPHSLRVERIKLPHDHK